MYTFQSNPEPHTTSNNILKSRDWARGSYWAINRSLASYNWDLEFMHLDLEQMTQRFTTILNHLSIRYVPPKGPPGRAPPWHKKVSQSLKKRKVAWSEYLAARRSHG
ncbi:hypothetical protein Pcinc_009511 [Petrolisthes cinctipes]|uniref:Uncharacterized protein n=1 Tax=Petrolisthes cinctipes TaxID=88211 RepID=A0AAE1G5A1_PETCI|nr:hypothetical protein Pcinc_009511 [Petrolisthes cinctipes]